MQQTVSRDYIARFLNAAADNPDAVAIKAGKNEITYRELEHLVRRFAAAYAAAGADRVLIALAPGIHVYAAILGSGESGLLALARTDHLLLRKR